MADYRLSPFAANQPDIQQMLREAQHRWLHPAEICAILRNYKQCHIAPQPAHMPKSGSVFLFDRKVSRYFRKDGHNWRKNNEGHEKLKCGSIDVLHCYYAYGEDDENFQRRSYWLIPKELSHIALVHYRDVKGNKINFNHIKEYDQMQKRGDTVPNSEADISLPEEQSDVPGMDFVTPSWIDEVGHTTDSASIYEHRNHSDSTLWKNNTSSSIAIQSVPVEPPSSSAANTVPMIPKQTDDLPGHLLTNNLEESANNLEAQEFCLSLHSNSVYELNPKSDEQKIASDVSVGSFQSSRRQENDHTIHGDLQRQFSDVQHVKQHSLNGHSTEEGLKRLDSFNRWTSKELGDLSEPKKPSSVAYWHTIYIENAVDDPTMSSQALLDGYTLGHFHSQDQYSSIIDFSPNWVYVGSETKALVRGRQVRKNYKRIIWSVGIVVKVILLWRRKQSGLLGFKSETLTCEDSSKSDTLSKEDDYDFLKEGRKRSEERSKVGLSCEIHAPISGGKRTIQQTAKCHYSDPGGQDGFQHSKDEIRSKRSKRRKEIRNPQFGRNSEIKRGHVQG
ncbi:hypothetical protein K2173_005223 [Erythroxylum novogranatense]|uniref:CG-1 domain-containing protein n=1 Tax=Erythroxylum novogranatense TaxID=1862640 RepID=A0AAV8TUK7_9ROSI|nr:hypothetical protein K2173_005223 [Erythroxylum novogranatense]